MATRSLAKSFDIDEQRRFARLSGDYNPLHLDPVYSRRLLFGEPVVHGIHLVFCGLEHVLGSFRPPTVLKELKATFRSPLPLKTPVTIEAVELESDRFKVQYSNNYCELAGKFMEDADPDAWSLPLPSEGPRLECKDVSFTQSARATGCIPLFLDTVELRAMFPQVAERLPAVQAAQILATTRLTGMQCPGLHTVYDSMELHFAENVADGQKINCGRRLCRRQRIATHLSPSETPPTKKLTEMHYEVCKSDERFSLVQLSVKSFGMEGTLTTFYRPPPVRQPSLSEVAEAVRQGEFQHQRALIVGGSRGLGELAAKIVAAGGGAVRITYHRGKEDADRVVSELCEAGADCRCFSLDVTQDVADAVGENLADWNPTHLYYFATPHITSLGSRELFSAESFARFSKFYLEGFASVVGALKLTRKSPLVAFYPSSIFVDTPVDGLVEYAAAKSAGEFLCRSFQQQFPSARFVAPRLPRVPTDQTASIGPLRRENALDVMIQEIRKLT